MIKTGLKNNWQQFTLLVLVNAFVGGMVGLERSVLPILAVDVFGIEVQSSILSFIIAFGIAKALANYAMGKLAKKHGRKRLLLLGWLIGLPVPFILMYAPDWNWIIVANVFLGVNQGFAWSATVIMKIDLVGEEDRGLAMGINEFSGYLAVGLVAFATSWIAAKYGVYPYPFYLGVVIVLLGLMLSFFFVKDTEHHLQLESQKDNRPHFQNLFLETSIRHPNLGSVTQAGMVNNMNDGMIWGVLPLVLTARNFSIEEIGIVVAVYPAVWGIGQLFTGRLADIFCKRDLLFWGMMLQAFAISMLAFSDLFWFNILASSLLGFGTALVYPTFLVAIADNIHPEQRAESIGIFRMWRDLGYAIGALLTGIIADFFDMMSAIHFIAILTLLSALIIRIRMYCQEGKYRLSVFK